jgi:hypothetical protein
VVAYKGALNGMHETIKKTDDIGGRTWYGEETSFRTILIPGFEPFSVASLRCPHSL